MFTLIFTILVFLPSISIIACASIPFSLNDHRIKTTAVTYNAMNRNKRLNITNMSTWNRTFTFDWTVSLSQLLLQRPWYSWKILIQTEIAAFKLAETIKKKLQTIYSLRPRADTPEVGDLCSRQKLGEWTNSRLSISLKSDTISWGD